MKNKYVSKTKSRTSVPRGRRSISPKTASKRRVQSRGLVAHTIKVLSSWFGGRSNKKKAARR